MKELNSILLIILLAAGLASSYEYHMPVNIEATLSPAVLLPGDEAIMAIEMSNGGASYGAGKDAGAGSSATGTLLSTPLNKTTLKSTPELKVLTEEQSDLGMIGPSDKIAVYYKVRAADNISSGTHLLDFRVSGGYDVITINREIPLKVDDTAVSMARAETDASNFNLNVANPRENTLNAVTIVPSAKGIVFSPDEYYIGTMDPDEVFTISFGITSQDATKTLSGPINLSFIAKFKNGDNWHTSQAYATTYSPPKNVDSQSGYLLPAGAMIVIVLITGGYLYRRRKLNGKNNSGNGKSQKDSRTL
jgi:hypothetical protein